jgi:hypothetical protein
VEPDVGKDSRLEAAGRLRSVRRRFRVASHTRTDRQIAVEEAVDLDVDTVTDLDTDLGADLAADFERASAADLDADTDVDKALELADDLAAYKARAKAVELAADKDAEKAADKARELATDSDVGLGTDKGTPIRSTWMQNPLVMSTSPGLRYNDMRFALKGAAYARQFAPEESESTSGPAGRRQRWRTVRVATIGIPRG